MVKQVPLVHRNKNDKEDEDNFLERTRAEAIVPMLLREDEKAAPHVVKCLGVYYTTKTEVVNAVIVMERCPMTLRKWLECHEPSLSVSGALVLIYSLLLWRVFLTTLYFCCFLK